MSHPTKTNEPTPPPANGVQRVGIAVGIDFAMGQHRSVAVMNQIVGVDRILASFDGHLCDAAPQAGNPAEACVGSVGKDLTRSMAVPCAPDISIP
jgi:hypothetical protein